MKKDIRYLFFYYYYRIWFQPQLFKITRVDEKSDRGDTHGFWIEHIVLRNILYFESDKYRALYWWKGIHIYIMASWARPYWRIWGIKN